MDVFLRFTASSTLVIGLLIGVSCAQPEWASSLGLDFWRLPEYQMKIVREKGRSTDLAVRSREFTERSSAKDKLVQDLADGSLDLPTALAKLANMEDISILLGRVQFLHLSGKNETERLGSLLIHWAEVRYLNAPKTAASVRQRLESQWQDCVKNNSWKSAKI